MSTGAKEQKLISTLVGTMQTKNHNINSSYALRLEDNQLLFFDTLEETAHAAYDLGFTEIQLNTVIFKVRFDHLDENKFNFLRGYLRGIKKTKGDNVSGTAPSEDTK